MIDLPYGYAAVAVLLAGLAVLVIQSNRSFRFRLMGLLIAFVAIFISYAGFSDLLSRPKPVAWEITIGDIEELEVAYADLQPGTAINLLLRIPGVAEPRLYSLPWRNDIAQELEQAMETAESEQVPVRSSPDLFEIDLEDRERLFYATPMAGLPPKDQQRFEPNRFVPTDDTTMYGAGGEGETETGADE